VDTLASISPSAQIQHYIKMSHVCSPMILRGEHIWGDLPPALCFLKRAFDLACDEHVKKSQLHLLQQIACQISITVETLDYFSKLCWVKDEACEDHSFLLALCQQMHTLSVFLRDELKPCFFLPPRLSGYIKFCINGGGDDEFTLKTIKELWGIKTGLGFGVGSDLGICELCLDIGTWVVGGESRRRVIELSGGIPDVPPPSVPKFGWLTRQLEIASIFLSAFLKI